MDDDVVDVEVKMQAVHPTLTRFQQAVGVADVVEDIIV